MKNRGKNLIFFIPVVEWHCLTLVLFSIFVHQGVYARHLLGNASAPNASQFGQSVEPFATCALQIAKRFVAHVPTRVAKRKCQSLIKTEINMFCKRKHAVKGSLTRVCLIAEILSGVCHRHHLGLVKVIKIYGVMMRYYLDIMKC